MPRMKEVGLCGTVHLVRRGKKYAMRYLEAGKWQLRSCRTADLELAKRLALELSEELRMSAEIERDSALGRIRIDLALEQGIAHARGRSEGHRANMDRNAARLCEWLSEHHPEGVYWHQMRQQWVTEWIVEQIDKGNSTQTIRLGLNPLRLAQNWVNLVDPDRYRQLRFSHPRLVAKRTSKRYLERDQMLELLDVVRGKGLVNAELVVLLCGFCGLRVSEAISLERHQIDPRGLIGPVGTKTLYSERTIPAPLWVVRRVLEIAPTAGPIVTREDGSTPETRSVGHWYLQAHLDRFQPRTTARNLRTAFATMAVTAGVPAEELRAYMGHRPATVLEEHYVDYRPDVLRERVVERIEAHFAKPKAQVMEVNG